jgi:hypothetical protein
MSSNPHCRLLVRLASSLVCLLTGCVAVPSGVAAPLRASSSYLIHLPGIAGDTAFDRSWMKGLRDGGAAGQVQLYDWTCRRPGLDALQAYDRNRSQAGKVARLITERRRAHPGGQIILTAESGGTGVAIWALERLPHDVSVDQVVLIAPALSPSYDLSGALEHVEGTLRSFNSPGDWFMLGIGTRLFGTIDGVHTEAAGLVGFRRPDHGDVVQYRKLVEMNYDGAWSRYGDWGNHAGAMSAAFARYFLAPMLLRDERRNVAGVMLSAGGDAPR